MSWISQVATVRELSVLFEVYRNMSELSSIPLSQGELLLRISLVANGYSMDKVSDLLGGSPYKREMEGDKLRAFWRFRILESERDDPYKIYLGEFVDGQLVFGFILPHA